MRDRLRHELVFLLVRTATAIDTGYTLLIAKTLTRVATSRDDTVQVPVARSVVKTLSDWSEPVQVRFGEDDNGWQMYVRGCEAHVAIEETIRARAARQ